MYHNVGNAERNCDAGLTPFLGRAGASPAFAAEGAASLPQFVKDQFDAFLECGILAHGFLRVRCAACGHEKLVAFSCKLRGICTSCRGRRMAETAAWLVDRVIPPSAGAAMGAVVSD